MKSDLLLKPCGKKGICRDVKVAHIPIIKKDLTTRGIQIGMGIFFAFASILVISDYVALVDLRRGLCEAGQFEEANALLDQPRGLASSIIAYVDESLNGSEDPCESYWPNTGVFGNYPVRTYSGGDGIPHRPYGTIAYVTHITRCPEWYNPEVSDADPGSNLYEASAVIKDQICNATATMEALESGTSSNNPQDRMGHTLYTIVNPNGVTCPVPGTDELYDRVGLLKDMGYRVHIAGQPITETMLLANGHDYIAANIESDVGIRDSTKLWAMTFVEHPLIVFFNYDCIFQYRIVNAAQSLLNNPNLKGYYTRTPPCNENGDTLIDTSFMMMKPSVEEFNNIIEVYLSTPYDPVTGWNGEGHHQCDGKMGLPGFLSYYFSTHAGYKELDRCKYSFVADDECIKSNVKEDAKTAVEIANVLESNGQATDLTTQEAQVANDAAASYTKPIDEVRILPVDETHPTVSAEVHEEEEIVIMEVYVQVMVSVQMMVKRTVNGVTTTEMQMRNMWITQKQIIEQIYVDPSFIEAPQIVEDPLAEAMVSAAVTRPVVAKQSYEICGKPTDCPPDDPNWTRSQILACQELHKTYFEDRKRTESGMLELEMHELTGPFKPESFLGFCNGPGPEGYMGMKDY